MSECSISKRNVAPGWAEFTIRIPRPEPDTDDYSFHGEPARDHIAIWFSQYVQGMLEAGDRDDIAVQLEQFLDQWFAARHGAALPRFVP